MLSRTSYETSHSIMSGWFANQSCDPFTPREQPCVVGTYVQYAVNASDATDVAKAVKFADEKNIRLVVRNTGHE
jgi:FAD/FMN-containing dehydrogenase